MSDPMLPIPATGEVLLIATCYEDDSALWNEVLDSLGGCREGDALVLGDGRVRLRPLENPRWAELRGGNFPALAPAESGAPVVALADIDAVYGGSGVLLVDLREVPGRGVRILPDSLERVLAGLLAGSVRFDELVLGMDRFGIYEGDCGEQATPTPTAVIRTSFPGLPACESTLLVRTDFSDPEGWLALLLGLGGADEDDNTGASFYPDDPADLHALVVEDRAFESLQPGQVPALVPPGPDTTMVALADATTMADPARPLLVVDIYGTPGQAVRIPAAEAGSMAINLQISNMDFGDFA
jgi:hypothetical protein